MVGMFILLLFLFYVVPALGTRCTAESAKEVCPTDYPCCSKYGYCGNSEEHCSVKNGCLFGCWEHSKTTTLEEAPSSLSQDLSRDFKRSLERKTFKSKEVKASAVQEKTTNSDFIAKQSVFRGCNSPQHITLTFDDGPSPYTNGILDILRDFGLKAAFFVIGSNINSTAENRAAIKRIVGEGHVLGSHSWSHPDLTTLSDEEVVMEMTKTSDLIFELTVRPKFVRPPYGSIDERVRRILQKELNYSIVLWNLDSNDWKFYRKHPSKIYGSFVASLPNGGAEANVAASPGKKPPLGWISLQHDLYEPSLLQLEDIISLIIRRNLKIVPLPTCIGDTGPLHY